MSSSTDVPSEDDKSFWNIRLLKFRVLIVGRANAGKTTILERLMDADREKNMNLVRISKIGHTYYPLELRRGLHNVEDEIHFAHKPGFIFHDSRGVEAGSGEELSVVQQFVEHRSSVDDSREQLHAIWYNIPLLI
ncbi:hypothetical protein B0H11DRAFT_1756810 [Mycena galericulata]|nr:hypothetical protein B0H11DRAFT_1756810 [Mycena galericulata]